MLNNKYTKKKKGILCNVSAAFYLWIENFQIKKSMSVCILCSVQDFKNFILGQGVDGEGRKGESRCVTITLL